MGEWEAELHRWMDTDDQGNCAGRSLQLGVPSIGNVKVTSFDYNLVHVFASISLT